MRKTDDEIVTVGLPAPKIADVAALDGFAIKATWHNGRHDVVDLGAAIHTFKVYAPLRDDRALFESVHVVNPFVVAWGGADAIDMHTSEIARLAGEVMEPGDFKSFLETTGLTWDGAAAQLGLSRRTVGYYAKGAPIPRYIALACAYLRLTHQGQGRATLPLEEPS